MIKWKCFCTLYTNAKSKSTGIMDKQLDFKSTFKLECIFLFLFFPFPFLSEQFNPILRVELAVAQSEVLEPYQGKESILI